LQRQERFTDHGLFAIAVMASLAHREDPSVLHSNQLTTNFQSLPEQTALLEGKITNLLKSFNQYSTPASPPSSEPPPLINAVDEVLDRESCKCNVIAYSLPESNTDASIFSDTCNFLGVEAKISSTSRLGKKMMNTTRPLRVCALDSTVNKCMDSARTSVTCRQYQQSILHEYLP